MGAEGGQPSTGVRRRGSGGSGTVTQSEQLKAVCRRCAASRRTASTVQGLGRLMLGCSVATWLPPPRLTNQAVHEALLRARECPVRHDNKRAGDRRGGKPAEPEGFSLL